MSKPVITIDVQLRTGYKTWETAGVLSEVQSCTFEFITNGRFGTATLNVQQRFNEDGFIALASKQTKRLLYRLDGVPIAIAFLRRPVRSWSDLQTHHIEGIGPVDEMNHKRVEKTYVPPGGSQDLSWFYFKLGDDFVIPYGYADQSSVEFIGIPKKAVTFNGTLREALTDLGTLAEGFIYWGLQIENGGELDGTVTFFVRKRDSAAAPVYEPLFDVDAYPYDPLTDAYRPIITQLEHSEEDQELVNKLYIDGGTLPFPNMAVNPSFEVVKQGGSSSSNLLRNASFDNTATAPWTLINNASIKTEANDPSDTPQKHLELDRLNEAAEQEVFGISPDTLYGIDVKVRAEAINETLQGRIIMRWYDHQGGTLIRGDSAVVSVDVRGWVPRSWQVQSPAGATFAVFRLEVVSLVSESNEHGILFDTCILYEMGQIYQEGWRADTSASPSGASPSVSPASVYSINWMWDYDKQGGSPGPTYGTYGVYLDAYGKTGGTYARIIASAEGEVSVAEQQAYTLAIWAKATQQDGSEPVGANLRLGIVWIKEDHTVGGLVNKDVTVSSAGAVYSGSLNMPTGAVAVRIYFEALQAHKIWLDGVYFGQAAKAPLYYSPDDRFHAVVDVHDVYDVGDAEYNSINDPTDDPATSGYGVLEERIANEAILDYDDALRFARTLFDVRALPRTTENLTILQTDSPITLFGPDGFLQVDGQGDYATFPFPKLWPLRVGYEWSNRGLIATVELEKEIPRIDNIIGRGRLLSVTSVGTGAETEATYNYPVNTEHTVLASYAVDDPIRVEDIVLGDRRRFIFTDPDGDGIFWPTVEFSIRGLDAPKSWGHLSDDAKSLIIELPVGDSFFEDDIVTIFYQKHLVGTSVYMTKRVEYVATAPAETYVLPTIIEANGDTHPEVPLGGSWRVYLREQQVPPSKFTILLNPSTGLPDRFSIDASQDVQAGDDILVRYFPDDGKVHVQITYEKDLDASGQVVLPWVPYFWNQGPASQPGYALAHSIGGLFQKSPVVTLNVDGDAQVAVPTDRVGDRFIARFNIGF